MRKTHESGTGNSNGPPGEARTHDPLLRRQMLYPTELRADTFSSGRGGEIRTRDILLPKQARYRAALHPEETALYESNAEGSIFPSFLVCSPLKSLLSFSSPQEEAVS